MRFEPSPSQRAAAQQCAAAATFTALLVVVGWVLQIDVLQRFHPALPPMAPNSALMAVLLGTATCLVAGGWNFARAATTLACGSGLPLGGAPPLGHIIRVGPR